MKALYSHNQDTSGMITFTDADESWLNIQYPVMYSGDNEFYLYNDFQKSSNKNGCPFFDYRNDLSSPNSVNKSLIIYGHNMASGQMFAKLNNFLRSVNYARSAPRIDLSTLYEENQYAVFAVMLISTDSDYYFNYLRTDFSSDDDFMNFVANIRARSLYDYPIDVLPSDELLILSTCTAKSTAKFDDGRCVIVARKVHDDESVGIRSTSIVDNNDVIMPYLWYVNQEMEPHTYYTESDYTTSTSITENQITAKDNVSTNATSSPTNQLQSNTDTGDETTVTEETTSDASVIATTDSSTTDSLAITTGATTTSESESTPTTAPEESLPAGETSED
jgi:SrtB family sortase